MFEVKAFLSILLQPQQCCNCQGGASAPVPIGPAAYILLSAAANAERQAQSHPKRLYHMGKAAI